MAHESVEWMADYLDSVGDLPVFPSGEPGSVRAALAAEPPEAGESMDEVLADFRTVIVPNLNHWNHPAFFGYFPSTGSGAGILGEMLAATVNVNAMVWRSAPAATELEDVATDWLRQLLGLPAVFEGVINDTASSSTMYALAAAREVAYPEAHESGLFGLPRGRVYASDQAHSSIEKAVLTVGFGREGFCAVPSDGELCLDAAALRRAIEADLRDGVRPVAIVATVGTTSSGSVDPVREIASIAEEFGVWMHVDAAYGGSAAMVPETAPLFDGWEEADSVVVNPHKWLFTPIDCSVLYCRRPAQLVRAFSIVPEYLDSAERAESRSLMDYGVSLGRRFRSLKLWFVLRYFGREGLVSRLRLHLSLARGFADDVAATEGWVLAAPVHFGAVAFRFSPGSSPEEEDAANHRIIEHVNATGEAFLTHTVLGGRTVIRLAIGNVKTTESDVARVWELLQSAAAEAGSPGTG